MFVERMQVGGVVHRFLAMWRTIVCDGRRAAGREGGPSVTSPALDLATLPASRQQRRAALVAIAVLCAVAGCRAALRAQRARHVPELRHALRRRRADGPRGDGRRSCSRSSRTSRRPSLLILACGTLFSAIVFVPYIADVSGIGPSPCCSARTRTRRRICGSSGTSCCRRRSCLRRPRDARRRPARRLGRRARRDRVADRRGVRARSTRCSRFGGPRAPLTRRTARTSPGVVRRAGAHRADLRCRAGAAAAAPARHRLRRVADRARRRRCCWSRCSTRSAAARYSVGWYLSRVDMLVATTFLVIALLAETNRLSRRLASSERRLRGIVDGVADALVAVDERTAVTSVNPAAAALFGFVAEDLAGTPVSRILPEYADIAECARGARSSRPSGRDARGDPRSRSSSRAAATSRTRSARRSSSCATSRSARPPRRRSARRTTARSRPPT